MGSCNPNYILAAGNKMLKTVLAVCVLLAVVEGTYYGYGSGYGDYGYGGYGGHGYGGYGDYYHYDPRVTATHAAYSHPRPSTSAYPVPAHRQGYSSHGYGNVVYPVNSAYLYSQVQGHGVYGEVDSQHYPSQHYPYNYYPRHY